MTLNKFSIYVINNPGHYDEFAGRRRRSHESNFTANYTFSRQTDDRPQSLAVVDKFVDYADGRVADATERRLRIIGDRARDAFIRLVVKRILEKNLGANIVIYAKLEQDSTEICCTETCGGDFPSSIDILDLDLVPLDMGRDDPVRAREAECSACRAEAAEYLLKLWADMLCILSHNGDDYIRDGEEAPVLAEASASGTVE